MLKHGGLQLNTQIEMKVLVNCISVTPLAAAWTRYDVADADGNVTVAAYENDVRIHFEGAGARGKKKPWASDVTVHQGEVVTRDEKCGPPAKPTGPIAASGAILADPWVIAGGAALVIGLTCIGLCRTTDSPLSPDKAVDSPYAGTALFRSASPAQSINIRIGVDVRRMQVSRLAISRCFGQGDSIATGTHRLRCRHLPNAGIRIYAEDSEVDDSSDASRRADLGILHAFDRKPVAINDRWEI